MSTSLIKPPQDAATIRRLRRGIGILGMALPFLLVIGNALVANEYTLRTSMSGYYYTDMRDVFVGGMCAIGVFLLCYRYQRLDDVLSTLAGILAIAVALLPITPDDRTTTVTDTDRLIGRLHMYSAAALFLLLAAFCIFVFTRTDEPAGRTAKKRARNRIYYVCGGIILIALAAAVASHALPASTQDTYKPLFWCQTVAVLAFGAAWLVKGDTIFRDAQPAGGASNVPALGAATASQVN